MEEIIEGPIKFVARILLLIFRGIIWLTWEMMCERLLWYLGWPAVRTVTLGTFPKESFNETDKATLLVHLTVAFIGLLYPLIFAFLLNRYLST